MTGDRLKLPGKEIFPWIVTAALLIVSLTTGVFFRGTDSPLFLPSLGGMVIFGVITLWPGFQKGWEVPRGWLVATVLLYGIAVWASVFWSTVPYNSTLFALIFSLFPFVFIVSILAQNRTKWLGFHLAAVGAAGAVLAIWSLIQFFVLYDQYGPRIHHPMLNPNNLAALFNLCLFPALALYFWCRKKPHMVFSFFLVMLYFAAMLVTQGRGALLAFAIAGIVFFAFVRRNKGVNWRKVLMLLVGGAALFLTVNSGSSGKLSKGLVQLPQDNQSMVERQLIWGATLEMIKANPWTGTGLGTFVYYYPRYRSPVDMSDGYFAHMDPLQFWAEMGILAPVLFYTILLVVMAVTVRAVRTTPPDSPQRLWLMGSFCALLTLAGHSHISFHLYIPVPLIMAGLLMAFWYDQAVRILKPRSIAFKPASALLPQVTGKALFVITFAFPLIWMAYAAAGVHYAGKASEMMRAGAYEQGYRNILMAQKFAPQNWDKPYDLHMRHRIDQLTAKGKVTDLKERKKLYEEALFYAHQARARNPFFTNLWNYQAMLHFIAYPHIDKYGRVKSIALLKETLAANPLLLDARMGLGNVYKSKKEYAKALAVLEEGLRYPMPITPSSLGLYNEIARIKLTMGDRAGHDRTMAQAKNFAARIKVRQKK